MFMVEGIEESISSITLTLLSDRQRVNNDLELEHPRRTTSAQQHSFQHILKAKSHMDAERSPRYKVSA